MQRAVKPKPVAAILATVSWSLACTLQRSFTMPVFGLACSQKNKKFALSRSFKNWSSSGLRENVGSSGGGESCGGDCAQAAIIPDAGTQRPAVKIRRMNSRREAWLSG